MENNNFVTFQNTTFVMPYKNEKGAVPSSSWPSL